MGFVIGLVHGEGDTFGISFPDFPGCVAGGSTLDETVSRGEDALAVHVKSMLEDGESLPVPRSRSAIVNDPEFSEDVKDATFVALPLPNARRVRVHVMIDESLLSAVERAATSEGYTRSGYFERAIRDRLVRQSESPILSPLSERSASWRSLRTSAPRRPRRCICRSPCPYCPSVAACCLAGRGAGRGWFRWCC